MTLRRSPHHHTHPLSGGFGATTSTTPTGRPGGVARSGEAAMTLRRGTRHHTHPLSRRSGTTTSTGWAGGVGGAGRP